MVAVLAAALALVVGAATGAQAESRAATHFAVHEADGTDGGTYVVRWDPCAAPITVRINTRAVPRGQRRSVVHLTRVAVHRLAQASGLRFRYRGHTADVPSSSNLGTQPADLVVAFVDPDQTDFPLAGWTAGYGGTLYHTGLTSAAPVITQGFVVIDQPQTARWSHSTHQRGITLEALLLHELGHAVGLDHVSDRGQVMAPELTSATPPRYAAGDLAGLREVGKAAGCPAQLSAS